MEFFTKFVIVAGLIILSSFLILLSLQIMRMEKSMSLIVERLEDELVSTFGSSDSESDKEEKEEA
ncbi:MAG: hypothetical protein ACLFQK_08315 [Fibrobacterota bacterium]